MSSCEELRAQLSALGQEHIFAELPELTPGHPVYEQLSRLDIRASLGHFAAAKATTSSSSENENVRIEPVPAERILHWKDASPQAQHDMTQVGLDAIKRGLVGAVMLSGGQGTRLGFDGPKGMYDMHLPSRKTIFQLHVERLLKIRSLCISNGSSSSRSGGGSGGGGGGGDDGAAPSTEAEAAAAEAEVSIPFYIMTSDLNHEKIKAFFLQHNYFGYPARKPHYALVAQSALCRAANWIARQTSTSLARGTEFI